MAIWAKYLITDRCDQLHYLGGKSRLGKKIAAIIASYRRPGQLYYEPFCGALGVLCHIPGAKIASDINQGVITLYNAMLHDGWMPPDFITRAEYLKIKGNQDLSNPLTAWAGIAYSFGGGWFQGYFVDEVRHVVQLNALKRKLSKCADITFQCRPYDAYTPHDMMIYCDPPYDQTTGYNMFDSTAFWCVMREWSKTNTVLISEYNAPADFRCIAEYVSNNQYCLTNRAQRIEKVWTLNPEQESLFIWPN